MIHKDQLLSKSDNAVNLKTKPLAMHSCPVIIDCAQDAIITTACRRAIRSSRDLFLRTPTSLQDYTRSRDGG